MKKHSLILSAAVAASLASGAVFADVSANVAASTNYLWRGVTQTLDTAAVSGGLDWTDSSGAYAGMWASGIAGGQEVDYYAGFATDMFDIGVLSYQYPVNPEFGFTEVYVTGAFSNISAGVYATVDAAAGNTGGSFDKGDLYVNVSADFEPVTVWVGSYMFDNDGAGANDYMHYGVSMAKDDFTISLEKNDIDEGDALSVLGNADTDAYRIVVSWSKEWAL